MPSLNLQRSTLNSVSVCPGYHPISLLLRQTVILRKRLGYEDLPEVRDYAWRYAQWRKATRQARRDAEHGDATSGG